MKLPIALTCGDPSGVGLEITLKAWQSIGKELPFFLISDQKYMSQFGKKFDIDIIKISHPNETQNAIKIGLPVLNLDFATSPKIGVEHPENAITTIKSIEMAVKFVQDQQASSLCTLPINKKVLKDGAHFIYPGHTEFLAYLGKVEHSYMMLLAPELKVVPVTIHIPLSEVKNHLTPKLLRNTIIETDIALRRDFKIASPRLAVSGLNPHAGEGGAMGMDEQKMITPLLNELRHEGLNLIGPLPADTMFHQQAREKYDAAICMYHDQALIPLKTLNFSKGVNVTLGLPFVRTSPDHGTAFDIAGKGIADPSSLIEALKCAAQMATNRSCYDA